jgi:hypothetical protein
MRDWLPDPAALASLSQALLPASNPEYWYYVESMGSPTKGILVKLKAASDIK